MSVANTYSITIYWRHIYPGLSVNTIKQDRLKMPHRDTSVQYCRTNLRLYIQTGLALTAPKAHKPPIS